VTANGHTVSTTYDTLRALPLTTTDFNPLGNGDDPITHYQWHPTFDKIEVVTSPTNQITRFHYYTSGDREWQEDGRGLMSRTIFFYNADRQLNIVQTPANAPGAPLNLDHFEYDPTLGNFLSSATPKGATTTYHRDLIGRVDSVASPINDTQFLTQTFELDLTDRVRTERQIGPAVTYSTLSSFSQRTSPALTLVVARTYDDEGNLLTVERRSGSESSSPNNPFTQWTYDAAGRRLTQSERGGSQQAWVYDAAGNATDWSTGRLGVVIKTTYDTLNRPTHKVVPGVSRSSQVGTSPTPGQTQANCTQTNYHAPRFPFFSYSAPGFTYNPLIETDCDYGGTALPPNLEIPADTSDFTYDDTGSGNLKTANNNDAHITREYFANGALKSETQDLARIADITGPKSGLFGSHVYRMDWACPDLMDA
jgi:YD repeat-containing protein